MTTNRQREYSKVLQYRNEGDTWRCLMTPIASLACIAILRSDPPGCLCAGGLRDLQLGQTYLIASRVARRQTGSPTGDVQAPATPHSLADTDGRPGGRGNLDASSTPTRMRRRPQPGRCRADTYWARTPACSRGRPPTVAPKQPGPLPAFPLAGGRFAWWWRVLDSNQRRLSRRFYRAGTISR
jgi:hypothetical protein